MFFFSFIFYLFLFYPKHVYEQSYTHFLCFFFLFLLRQVYDYLMVSVTSTLHFRDTLHVHHQHRQQRMPLGHPLSSKGMFLAPQAHEEEKGPKRRVWRRLGPRCIFFILFFSVLLTTTAPNDADASFGPFCRFGFHLPVHHRPQVTTTRWRFPRLPSALPPPPTTRVHPLPRAGHLHGTSRLTPHTTTTNRSPHLTPPPPCATSPAPPSATGPIKKKKKQKKGSPATLFLFQVCFFPPPLPVSSPPNTRTPSRTCVRLTFFFFFLGFHN